MVASVKEELLQLPPSCGHLLVGDSPATKFWMEMTQVLLWREIEGLKKGVVSDAV